LSKIVLILPDFYLAMAVCSTRLTFVYCQAA